MCLRFVLYNAENLKITLRTRLLYSLPARGYLD